MSRPVDTPQPAPLDLATEISFRPLLLSACAFIAGILAGEHLGIPAQAVVWFAAALLVLVPVAFFVRRARAAMTVLVVLLAAACGFLRHEWAHAGPAPDDVSRLVPDEGGLLRVRGVIAGRPMRKFVEADGIFQYRDLNRTSFELAVDSAETKDGWVPASGSVLVNVYDNATDFACGDRIELLSRFTRSKGPRNPGEYDWRLHYERKGIRLHTALNSRAEMEPVLGHHRGSLATEVSHALGARLAGAVDRCHGPEEAGLLRCILLGERSAVDPDVDRNFRQAGLSDLLAVSGLHVVILLGGLWIALRFFLVSERAIAWAVILAAALYATIASFQPPIVRAAVVAGMVALGVLVRRKHDMVNSLAAAALALLVVNPHEIFSAGFQLSFAAVLGIVGLAGPIQRFLQPRIAFRGLDLLPGAHRWWRVKANEFFVTTLAVAAAAWLASQPLVARHFQILNPATMLLNLLLVPAFSVILLASFAALLVETAVGGFPASYVSGSMARALDALSEAAAQFPGAWVHFPSPPAWVLAVYYLLLALVAAAPALGLRRRWPAISLLALLAALVGREMLPHRAASDELVVLDVGQGSAALVRSGDGHAALVDVGTFGGRDVSRTIIIPWLVRERIFALDAVLLTHADSDHTSGLPTLLDNFRVRKVFLGETFKYTPEGLRVERWLIERGVPHEFVGAGQSVALGNVRLDVLHPPRAEGLLADWMRKSTRGRGRVDENERSSVVRGVTAGGSFVIFGDLAGVGVKQLDALADLRADVVVAPHHGGSSGGEAMAARYRWPLVLFSAGPNFAKTVEAYQSAEARTLVTAETGMIRVTFGPRVSVWTFFSAR